VCCRSSNNFEALPQWLCARTPMRWLQVQPGDFIKFPSQRLPNVFEKKKGFDQTGKI
jgi:hypothetical protein